MSDKLTSAVGYLPEKFITLELVMEAAKEHKPELLDKLPAKYLTEEVINEVFARKPEEYWWNCDLSKIPVEYRTPDICKKAFKCSTDNLPYIPAVYMDDDIVKKIISSPSRIQDISYIPQSLWNRELVFKALNASGITWQSFRYQNHQQQEKIRHYVQIILSFVPGEIKTQSFYLDFFADEYAPEMIELLTPKKFRNKEYYRNMSKIDMDRVPVKKITYDIMLGMLSKDSRITPREIFNNDEIREHFLGMLDDTLADTLITHDVDFFSRLPEKFQTQERMILAIRTAAANKENFSQCYYPEKLLTRKVVKEFIKCGISVEIPKEFWNEKLASFCFEQGSKKSYFWFRQMPPKFQTREMVTAAVNNSYDNLEYALKKHISKEITVKVIRDSINERGYCRGSYTKYLPVNHFTEFRKKTGLPENFMGGEEDFITLKDQRAFFSYCRLGNLFFGLHNGGERFEKKYHLVITRVEKEKEPEVLFDSHITTFHKTWLEKSIAESDPGFEKPLVDPSLKDVQGVSYYGVEFIENTDGFDVYRNTFYGITVGHCVKKDGLTCHADTVCQAMNGWKQKAAKEKQAEETPQTSASAFEDQKVTADLLHKKYNFCKLGMTAFVDDYNLDYNGQYSISELRQIVALQGWKPSVNQYHRELRRINVIQ